MLGTFKPADLASAIAMRDKATIARAPGVGPKVAERIVTELKDKAPAYADLDPAVVRLSGAVDEKRAPQPVLDAVSALVNLGYGQPQAAAAIAAAARERGRGRGDRATDPARAEGTGEVSALSEADRELVEAASDAIRKRYRYDWQEVGAALRTRSGKVFTGVSLDAYLGRMAVCAEAVALGQAITDRRRDRHRDASSRCGIRRPRKRTAPIAVVSPCGACRELIWDYDRNARVIVPGRRRPGVGRHRRAACRTSTAANEGT